MAQGRYVGAVGDLVGRELVMDAVAGDEGDVGAIVGEDVNGRCWGAPGGDGVQDRDGLVALELAQSCSADDGDVDRFWFERC